MRSLVRPASHRCNLATDGDRGDDFERNEGGRAMLRHKLVSVKPIVSVTAAASPAAKLRQRERDHRSKLRLIDQ
jgi:hypothetical protein